MVFGDTETDIVYVSVKYSKDSMLTHEQNLVSK